MISVDAIRAATAGIDPLFRDSPQYRSEGLSAEVGTAVLVKVESINPIGCFKGRGADWWVRQQAESRGFVCASAGNFGQALAYCARRRGVAVTVFAAEGANPAKIAAMERLGAKVRSEGRDFDAAKEAAVAFARQRDLLYVEDGRDDEIAAGAGTMAVEILRHPESISAIYVPVGNGALANGIGAWMRCYSPHTRVIGVCAAGAPSMERSWRRQSVETTERVATIADGVAVRVPVPEALDHLRDSVDDIVLVDDRQIVESMRAYYRHEHLVSEPAGAVSLAAALAADDLDPDATIVTILSGSNVDPRQQDAWLGPPTA